MQFPAELSVEILDSISEGLFTVDKDFRINFMNRAAEKITGLKRENVIGQFCKYVLKAEVCSTECPISSVLRSGKEMRNFISIIRPHHGKKVFIQINANLLKNKNGNAIGGVVSFRDVSELEAFKGNFEKTTQFAGMVTHNKEMWEIFRLIEEISESDAAVLIQGESGTGKEMIANAIQKFSSRKDRPFLKVSCSIFSPQLLASELFGHVKGAFTGAYKDRQGRFEIADGGTIFLDEVAEMPLEMQIQLLRVVQDGIFERIGESIPRKVNVRVIAATNKDIHQSLKEGSFREDLYYRLNVIPIFVPPLRERPEDISYLVQYFLNKFSFIYKKNITDLEDDALDFLVRYKWPGNIRELENAIEYAFARTKDEEKIETAKLPPSLKGFVGFVNRKSNSTKLTTEFEQITTALEKSHWNRSKAANFLGIGRTTLWRKIQKYGIDK